jgi:hypothetical protein
MNESQTRTFPEFSLSRLLKTVFEPKPGQRIGILIDLADPKQIEGFAFLKNAALTIQRHAHDVFYGPQRGHGRHGAFGCLSGA